MTDPHYLKDELYSLVSDSPEIFEFLQSGSLDGLWYWDIQDPQHEWMNARFWELLGYDPSEKKHLSSEWQDLIHPDDLAESLENFRKHCEDPSHPYDQVVRYRHKDGRTIWVRCRGIAIRDEQGRPVRMLGAHNDLTPLKELEEQLRKTASEDALTGLANRRSFDEHWAWTLANRERTDEVVSVAIIDLDHFKDVNDTYGHQVGDGVLAACATAIRAGVRNNDFPARWGGEEFIVLLHGAGVDESIAIAERVRQLVAEVDAVDGGASASIGVATVPAMTAASDTASNDQAIRAADRALYVAKESGRNRVVHAAQLDADPSS